MEQMQVKITGLSPLLMHSDRFANPLDPATKAHKALTSKRKKTDEDHGLIAESEWHGGLYYNERSGVHVPAQNIEASLVGGAKLQRQGTAFKRALMVLEDELPLEYKGPKTPQQLYTAGGFTDIRSVKVGTAKIMRCRPIFREWSLKFTIAYNESQVDRDVIVKALDDAGLMIGLGDYRPRFGKFEVEVMS